MAMFPCRPVQQTRQVALGDQPLDWHLHTCGVGSLTYAVGDADVVDPARVGPVLQSLLAAAQAPLQEASLMPIAYQVSGMTPQPHAGRWALSGNDAQGRRLRIDVALVSRGTHVVQAMVIGPAAPEAAIQPFFEGLRWLP
jgi:hypothetical protein